MALYRQVQVCFWDDPWIETLEPLYRYFYLFIMTNRKTTQCGIYEITKKNIIEWSGLDGDTVDEMIDFFTQQKKILFNEKTNEIILINWVKHNPITSPKIKICINKELMNVKNIKFVEKFYQICDSQGIEMQRVDLRIQENDHGDSEELVDESNTDEPNPPSSGDGKEKGNGKGRGKRDSGGPHQIDTPFQEIVDLYHKHCKTMSRVLVITEKRKEAMRIRFRTYQNLKVFENLFKKADESNFLSGRNQKWAGCNFDWLIKEANMIKVIEGSYKNSGTSPPDTPQPSSNERNIIKAPEGWGHNNGSQ